MVGISKALYHTVIRDGNGGMSPLIGTFHNVLCLGNTVHIAHLGMAVQFHPLFHGSIHPAGGKIRNPFDTRNRTNRQFMIKLIHHGDSLDFDKTAGF